MVVFRVIFQPPKMGNLILKMSDSLSSGFKSCFDIPGSLFPLPSFSAFIRRNALETISSMAYNSSMNNVLDYWRNSLADANRMSVSPSRLRKAHYIEKNIIQGKVTEPAVGKLFTEKKELIKRFLPKKKKKQRNHYQ